MKRKSGIMRTRFALKWLQFWLVIHRHCDKEECCIDCGTFHRMLKSQPRGMGRRWMDNPFWQ